MPRHSRNRSFGTDGAGDDELRPGAGNEDERIGLTEAFAPVSASGPFAHDDEDTGRIGLTQAFSALDDDGTLSPGDEGPLPDDAADEDAHAGDAAFDGAGHDGAGAIDGHDVDSAGDHGGADDGDERIGLTQAFAPLEGGEASGGAHAGGFSYEGDRDEVYPDALDSLEPVPEPPMLFGNELATMPEKKQGRHGRKQESDIPPYLRKSRRMRRILIAIIIVLLLIIGVGVYYVVQWFDVAQTIATQQTQEQAAQEVMAMQQEEAKDVSTETAKKTSAPNLVSLLGLTQQQAITALKSGAQVTSTKALNEEGNPIKTNVTVALTDEPADTRTGTPTVYLGLNEAGAIVQAGYSASTTALGYGSLSFSDAVKNEFIVEKTLQEAGIKVDEGSAVLPSNKADYSTYATDGTTLVKENCSFSGLVDIDGASREWSAVLSYDYTTANTSGNLANTIRIIYVYIAVPVA